MRRSTRERKKPTPLYEASEIQKDMGRIKPFRGDEEDGMHSDTLTSMRLVDFNRMEFYESNVFPSFCTAYQKRRHPIQKRKL